MLTPSPRGPRLVHNAAYWPKFCMGRKGFAVTLVTKFRKLSHLVNCVVPTRRPLLPPFQICSIADTRQALLLFSTAYSVFLVGSYLKKNELELDP